MNIVVLDGYAMNPGDLSWDSLNALGNVTMHDLTSPTDIVSRLIDADIAVVNKVVLDKSILKQLPNLKMIAETATGYNNIATDYARDNGIVVSNVPAYSTDSVVQMIFAHILNYASAVADHSKDVHNGKWENCEHFTFWNRPLMELTGKTLGIIGFGNIGSGVAKVAAAFGMNIIANNRSPKESDLPVTFTDRETVLSDSDFIVLSCALTDDTNKMINKESLKKMKSSAVLINTGRGPLIDEAALADALKAGEIAYAGVDVLTEEPPRSGSPLIGTENCSITPHIAWASVEARTRCLNVTVENISSFMAEKPQNRV